MKISAVIAAGLLLLSQSVSAEYAPNTWTDDIKVLDRLYDPNHLDIPVMTYSGLSYYSLFALSDLTKDAFAPRSGMARFSTGGDARSGRAAGQNIDCHLTLYKVLHNMGRPAPESTCGKGFADLGTREGDVTATANIWASETMLNDYERLRHLNRMQNEILMEMGARIDARAR